MMNKKRFERLYKKANRKSIKESEFEYENFKELLKEFNEISNDKNQIIKYNRDLVELCKTFSLEWGLRSLSCSQPQNRIAFVIQSIINTMANDIQAIISLLLNGLEYQAIIVQRNLYEISLSLLVFLIDDNKRLEFLNSAKNENEYLIWKKYFSHKKLIETLDNYEKLIDPNNDLDFIRKWRKDSYSYYSGFAHNDLFYIVSYSQTHPLSDDRDEKVLFNLWGGNLSRTNNILIEMADLLFYVDLLFFNILKNPELSIKFEDIVGNKNEQKNNWNTSVKLSMLNRENYLELKNKK